jgi:hypothetical protein
MISGLPADVAVAEFPPRPNNEDPAELPRIALNTRLACARAKGPNRVEGELRRQGFQAPSSQACGPEGKKFGVDQNRTIELKVLSESIGKILTPRTHDHEFGFPTTNILNLVAQLRDLLPAEDSAEMANKGEYSGPHLPIGFQDARIALPIREFYPADPFGH